MSALVSGEGVAIDLRRAGLGSRTVAGVIDIAVEIAVLLLAVTVTSAVGAGDSAVQAAVALVETVLILAGYPIVFEWLSRGRTLGKMALGLRVVRDDGGPIGFRQALVRGLAGFFLEKPGITLALGMITIGVTKSNKRVGDMMAGTFVVNERTGSATALAAVNWYVPPALHGWAQALDLTRVDDQLALQVRQFILRAAQMSPSAQLSLGEQFRGQVLALTAPPPPAGVPTPVLLTTVLAERRRRAEWALARAMPTPFVGAPAMGQPNIAGPTHPTVESSANQSGGAFAPPS
jgi:uncharacterized RDD family membrane protein YckC